MILYTASDDRIGYSIGDDISSVISRIRVLRVLRDY